jgi:hypothetical protein
VGTDSLDFGPQVPQGLPLGLNRARLDPLVDASAVRITERADHDDQIDEGPDAQAAERDEHQHAPTYLPDVEAMGTEDAEEEAQEQATSRDFDEVSDWLIQGFPLGPWPGRGGRSGGGRIAYSRRA